MKDIAAAARGCGSVLLATDPDREGEAISWHITQELQVGCTACVLPVIFPCVPPMYWLCTACQTGSSSSVWQDGQLARGEAKADACSGEWLILPPQALGSGHAMRMTLTDSSPLSVRCAALCLWLCLCRGVACCGLARACNE